jgi:hypothetical protein
LYIIGEWWVTVKTEPKNLPEAEFGSPPEKSYNPNMKALNFEQTLRAFHQRTPSRPFTVELVSGNRFQVDHPEALVLRDGVAVFIAKGGMPVVFDHEGVSQVLGDAMQASA